MLASWSILFILFALQLPGLSAHRESPSSFTDTAVLIVIFGGAGAVALFYTGRVIVRIVVRVDAEKKRDEP
jgi:hypothetical protein